MRSMSSQPSGYFWLLLDIPPATDGGDWWGVGVKAGLVKKYLYRLSRQEKRAEKFGGGSGHQARIRMSGGRIRLRIWV